MTISRTISSCFLASLLAACGAVPPKSDEVMMANYGNKPSRGEMVELVKEYASKTLFDPYSAKYSCSTPAKYWIIGGSGDEGNVQMGKTYFGYASVCAINAKNRFGAYTGNKESTYMIYVENGSKYLAHFDGIREAEEVP